MNVIDTETVEKRRVIGRRHYWRYREQINAERAVSQPNCKGDRITGYWLGIVG